MEFIVISSTILQFIAGFLALRLISETGKNWAWLLLSAGIFAMAFRRTHTLIEIYQSGNIPSFSFELLGLVISVLVLGGIYLIAPLLRDMRTAADKLAEKEERYRTVAEFTNDWEYWMAPDGNFIYVSPSCEKITGYASREFLNDPQLFYSIIHPDYKEKVLKKGAAINNLHKPLQLDFKIIDKSGQAHWVDYVSLPVYSAEGVFLGVRASARNIDQRKSLEKELKSSRALYENLVQNSLCMVLRLTSQGKVSFVNNYTLHNMGYVEDEVMGKHFTEVFFRKDQASCADALRLVNESLALGRQVNFEVEHFKKDGARFWGEWVNSAVFNEFGEIREFVCIGIDVTKRKVLEKIKDDVTRIVRHDLKSPLTGIIGIPRLVRKEENITSRQADLLKAVEDAGTIMLDMINHSLQMYMLETGEKDIEFEEFDLVQLVKEVIQYVQIGKELENIIELTIEGRSPEEEVITLPGERYLIFSMFGNLLRNAVESCENKSVSVDIRINDDCIIKIHNAGVVPASIRETFFEKYVTEGKSGGTGLGTYSARLIVEKHGGEISLNSMEEAGTTVTVKLPLTRETHAPLMEVLNGSTG